MLIISLLLYTFMKELGRQMYLSDRPVFTLNLYKIFIKDPILTCLICIFAPLKVVVHISISFKTVFCRKIDIAFCQVKCKRNGNPTKNRNECFSLSRLKLSDITRMGPKYPAG